MKISTFMTNQIPTSWPSGISEKSERLLKAEYEVPMCLIRKFMRTIQGSLSREEFGYSILNDRDYAKSYTIKFLIKIGIDKAESLKIFEALDRWIDINVSTPCQADAYDAAEVKWLQGEGQVYQQAWKRVCWDYNATD